MQIGREAHGLKSLNRHTLEQIIALSCDGVLLVDAQSPSLQIVYANPAYEDLTGYCADELAGQGWQLFLREANGDAELQRLKAAIGQSQRCRITVPDLRKDGTAWLAQVTVEPLPSARGDLKYFLCTFARAASGSAEQVCDGGVAAGELTGASGEISLLQRELGRVRQKVASLDRIDPATGLLRFSHFQETLRRDLGVAHREERYVTLLIFDIVEFDVYRQTFGAKAADSCQRMIGAQIMRTLRRAGDLCARYDEQTLVAAVLGQTPEEAEPLVEQIADNVRRLGLHNPRAKSSRQITIHPVLVGCPPGTQDDAEALVARALADLRKGSRGAHTAPTHLATSSGGSAS